MNYKCKKCGNETDNFEKWFEPSQQFILKHGEGYSICDECEQKEVEEEEFENEQFQKDKITCPACERECRDSWEYENDSDSMECGDCGELFSLEIVRTVTYTTRRVKDEGTE